MSDPEWLGVLVSVVAGAVSVGVSLGKLGAVTRDVRANRNSIEALGARLGDSEKEIAVLQARVEPEAGARRVRRPTRAPINDEGSDT